MKTKYFIIAALSAFLFVSCGNSSKPTGDAKKDSATVHQLVVDEKYSQARKFLEDASDYYQGLQGEAEMSYIIEFGVGQENLYKVMNAD